MKTQIVNSCETFAFKYIFFPIIFMPPTLVEGAYIAFGLSVRLLQNFLRYSFERGTCIKG